jgi:hypothetical protein
MKSGPMLLGLPHELLVSVSNHCRVHTVVALSRCSTHLNRILMPTVTSMHSSRIEELMECESMTPARHVLEALHTCCGTLSADIPPLDALTLEQAQLLGHMLAGAVLHSRNAARFRIGSLLIPLATLDLGNERRVGLRELAFLSCFLTRAGTRALQSDSCLVPSHGSGLGAGTSGEVEQAHQTVTPRETRLPCRLRYWRPRPRRSRISARSWLS